MLLMDGVRALIPDRGRALAPDVGRELGLGLAVGSIPERAEVTERGLSRLISSRGKSNEPRRGGISSIRVMRTVSAS